MRNKRGVYCPNQHSYLNKRGIVADYLPWIILAIVVLGVVMISLFLMKDTGFSLIDKLKGLFRGR